MDNELWAKIQRLKQVDRISERDIASKLSISRGKVRRYLKKHPALPKPKQKGVSKLDPFKPIVHELLEKYPTLSNIRLYQKLKQYGYPGKKTLLRDYLARFRQTRHMAYVRYETAPGEEAQVDWGFGGTVPVDGHIHKLYFFVMVLSHSRQLFVRFTISQAMDIFLDCHVKAFEYFAGIPRVILYDNLKSVVISRYVNHIEYNQKFQQFSGHYLFTPKPCNVRKPNEKGKVESGVKYVKQNFLAGREFSSLDDVNNQCTEWLNSTANMRVHGTTGEIPQERYLHEKQFLLPLPEHPYDTSVAVPVRAYHDCRVRFECNHYSVPARYISLQLTLRATERHIRLYHQTRLIASHTRCYGKGMVIDDPSHFKELLEMKKQARQSKLRDRYLALCPASDAYLEGLLRLNRNLKTELSEIMGLVDRYGAFEVIPALESALQHQAFGASYISNIIAQNRAKRQEKPILSLRLGNYPDFESVEVIPRDLSIYDEKYTKETHS